MAARRYTASHWGIYEVESEGGQPRLAPYAGDPDPNPIGLHQLDETVAALRVRRPAVRKSWLDGGPGSNTDRRGREPFVEVDWDTALDLAANAIARVRTEHGNKAIFGGSYGWSSAGRFHHAQSQVHRFLNAAGGYVRSVDTYSMGAGRVILPHIVGDATEVLTSHTSWDVLADHTRLFVAFGGVPAKNTRMSPGGAADHRVKEGLYAMGRAGTRFVNIGPVRDSLDAGVPVEWIPIRPNTDTALMLALAQTLLAEDLWDRDFVERYCAGFDAFRAYLDGSADGQVKSPEWAEGITGVPAETTRGLARDMAAARTMVNVAYALQRAAHGEQPFWAAVALAGMLGQVGLPGGGFGVGYGCMNYIGSPHINAKGPALPQGRNAVAEFIPVARIADMLRNPGAPFTYDGRDLAYPDIRLIYWAGGNPYHHHQDLGRLRRAWAYPETIIVNEQFWSATARHADIVLPATTSMERNDLGAAAREGHLVAMRQIVEPLGEARDDYAIFGGLARRLGCEATFTEGLDADGWLRRLYAESAEAASARGINMPDFDTFWEQGILDLTAHDAPVILFEDFRRDPNAHPLDTPSGRIEIGSEDIAGFGLDDCPGHPVWLEPFEWLGSAAAGDYPLHMLSNQPDRKLHSQLDHSPYSRDGKIGGREPITMNAKDAAARGIADGDVVEVRSPRGRCLAAAVLTDGILPGVVCLATGAWYDPDDEHGIERHGNPNAVTLDRGASGLSQGCAAQTCLVEVRRADADAPEPRPFELPALTPG